jgi:hypothetical protein
MESPLSTVPKPQSPNPSYLPAHLPTYRPTYLPIHNLPTYRSTYRPTYRPTYLHIDLPTYQPTYRPTYLPTDLPTYRSTYLPTTLEGRTRPNKTCMESPLSIVQVDMDCSLSTLNTDWKKNLPSNLPPPPQCLNTGFHQITVGQSERLQGRLHRVASGAASSRGVKGGFIVPLI